MYDTVRDTSPRPLCFYFFRNGTSFLTYYNTNSRTRNLSLAGSKLKTEVVSNRYKWTSLLSERLGIKEIDRLLLLGLLEYPNNSHSVHYIIHESCTIDLKNFIRVKSLCLHLSLPTSNHTTVYTILLESPTLSGFHDNRTSDFFVNGPGDRKIEGGPRKKGVSV